MNALNALLRHHVTGAIERGEGVAVVEIPAEKFFYLQHGNAGEPMRTERVPVVESFMTNPRKRGDAIPTYWRITWNGRSYRVWSSKARGHFITSQGVRIGVTI